MARWEPGARGRLRACALELYVEQGFEQTTVEEIARAAGLTERTFFRHFADKREVLFHGQEVLQQIFLDGVRAAPPDASPAEMIAASLTASAEFFPDDGRQFSRRRQAVITANAGLQERELLKMASLAAAIAEALRERGVAERAAVLAAETGVTVFGLAFAQWVADGEERSLADVESEVWAELGALAAGIATAPLAGSPLAG